MTVMNTKPRRSLFDRPAPAPKAEPFTLNVKPLRRWVFCRIPISGERVSDGGILIPETAYGRHDRATVLFAHPDATVYPGDRVCFDAYKLKTVFGHGQFANAQGTPLAREGDFFVIDEDNIFFIEEDDDE